MSNKSKVDEFFNAMSDEVCNFIKSSESGFSESWVPATYIKEQLDLKKACIPAR
ncbi:hypothetical protein [Oceanobacter antarcticus]|uniref:Uncharacterized protein n=1 Tax=Oceanobacter antarcticus TaxID=3133425 RepID=A0ABW8NHZ7_9GAMM